MLVALRSFAKDHKYSYARVELSLVTASVEGFDIDNTFSFLSRNLDVQLLMDRHGHILQNLCFASFFSQTQINVWWCDSSRSSTAQIGL
jgi:hypothetical protein